MALGSAILRGTTFPCSVSGKGMPSWRGSSILCLNKRLSEPAGETHSHLPKSPHCVSPDTLVMTLLSWPAEPGLDILKSPSLCKMRFESYKFRIQYNGLKHHYKLLMKSVENESHLPPRGRLCSPSLSSVHHPMSAQGLVSDPRSPPNSMIKGYSRDFEKTAHPCLSVLWVLLILVPKEWACI